MQLPSEIVADTSPHEKLLERLRTLICELLEHIDSLWESRPKRPPIYSTVVLSDTPISLQRHDYRYAFLFMKKPTTLCITVPGLRSALVSLDIGRNDLTLPKGTQFALLSGEMSVLCQLTDIFP